MGLFLASAVLCVLVVLAMVLGHRWLVSEERKHFSGTLRVANQANKAGPVTRFFRGIKAGVAWITRPIDWSSLIRRRGGSAT